MLLAPKGGLAWLLAIGHDGGLFTLGVERPQQNLMSSLVQNKTAGHVENFT